MTAHDVFEFTVPQYTRILKAMKGYLQKAAAHADHKKFDVNAFFDMRLAPDQYPLGKQIQVSTDMAKGFVARMSGKTAPVFEDTEKTLAEFYTRIDKTLSYVEGFKPSDFEGYEKRQVSFPWYPGKFLTGKDYVATHALPNFYFHVTIAYAILRENGVDLGKTDFLGTQPWQNL